jgi:hypothetical protein
MIIIIFWGLSGCGFVTNSKKLDRRSSSSSGAEDRSVTEKDSVGVVNGTPTLAECLKESRAKFEATVRPQLKACESCHIAGGAAGSTRFKTDPTQNVEALYASFLQFVNPLDPKESLILKKPSGTISHGGGKIFSDSAAEIKVISDFIAQATEDSKCATEALAPSTTVCKADSPRLSKRLWRLTQAQFENTISFGIGRSYANLAAIFADNNPTMGFKTNSRNLTFNELSVADLQKAALDISGMIARDFAPAVACISASGDRCAIDVGQDLAIRLWRSPANAAETASFATIFRNVNAEASSRSEAIEAVAQYVLLSPKFIYRFEIGENMTQPGQLSSYEIANFLSYTFWNMPPDQELRNRASDGSLNRPDIFAVQFERVVDDVKARDVVFEIFNDWLKIDSVLSVPKDAELFGNIFTPVHRNDLFRSARRMVDDIVWDSNGTLEALMTDSNIYVNNNVAATLGLSTAGLSSSFEKQSIPYRAGLLTHPAYIAGISGRVGTSMVHRGFFTLERVLGIKVPPPPANVTPSGRIPTGVNPATLTTRKEFELLHSTSPQCSGCHVKLDPVGGAFENFDAIGRYRDVEKGNVRIDSTGSLKEDGVDIAYKDSLEFVQKMVQSDRMSARFDEVLLGHLFGIDNPASFPCELEDLRSSSRNTASVRQRIKSLLKIRNLIQRDAGVN